jgi:hypothetical protein
MKRLFNARLFDVGPRKSKPRRSPQEVRDEVHLFPTNWTIEALVTALEAAHQPIAHYFGTGIGHELQFIESSILVRVLIALRRAGITALPIHDCVIVPCSKVEEAKTIMTKISKAMVGAVIPVTVEVLDDLGDTEGSLKCSPNNPSSLRGNIEFISPSSVLQPSNRKEVSYS